MSTMPHEVPSEYRELKKTVAERLADVCKSWPQADFDELVDDVSRTTWKYELRTLKDIPDERPE
jgi:hypothetical protein